MILTKLGRRGKNSTFEQRKLVIFHYERGTTCREIANLLDMKKSSIGKIICRYKNEDRTETFALTGRPRIFTRREEKTMVQKIKKDPRITEKGLPLRLKKSLRRRSVVAQSEEYKQIKLSLANCKKTWAARQVN